MKIVFCGAGPAAEKCLSWLVKRPYVAGLAVYTHPDKPNSVSLSHIAKQYDLWHTTDSINELPPPFEPDYIVSVYYRHLIRPIPKRWAGRIMNAHVSLLPRHRGRSSVPWAIIDGDQFSGVTFHLIDEGIDTGRILMQAAVQIEPDETQATLFDKINQAVIDYFPAAWTLLKSGFPGVEQRGEANTNYGGVPFDGEIDLSWTLNQKKRFIRAMTYPPLPYATACGEEVKNADDLRRVLACRRHSLPV